jgi:hypothetical protein
MTLPREIVVWVRDAEGKPVENAVVTFRIVAGGGSFDGQDTVEARTNRSGLAAAANNRQSEAC